MKLYSIHTGFFKLDGGAMFGVVPKSIWNNLYPADGKNLCTWAMRCLLIDTGDRRILIDNGMGTKQSEKFFSYYEPHGDYTLENSLGKLGYSPDDITDNFLTHLHFDHCGGGVKWNSGKNGHELTFPNAIYWTNEKQWQHALHPNQREKASFLKENLLPMQEHGKLKFIEEGDELVPGFSFLNVYGHTEAMMLPVIDYKGKKLVYMADLLPSPLHVPIAWVMAYDIRPLQTMDEKTRFLNQAVDNDYILFFEHDRETECCTLERSDKRVVVKDKFRLEDI